MGWEERTPRMRRVLKFEKDDTRRFELFYNGFVSGGNFTYRQSERSRDIRAKESRILKAIKAISTEAGETRALIEDGGTIVLDQKQFEILEKYLEVAPFFTQISDEVDELLDWVSAADKEKEEE